jgi:hypothetical protein
LKYDASNTSSPVCTKLVPISSKLDHLFASLAAFDDMIVEARAQSARERLEAARSAAAERIVTEAISAAVESAVKEAEAAETERRSAETERNAAASKEADLMMHSNGRKSPDVTSLEQGPWMEVAAGEAASGARAPLSEMSLDVDAAVPDGNGTEVCGNGTSASSPDSDHSFEKVERASPGVGNGALAEDWVLVGDSSGPSTPEKRAGFARGGSASSGMNFAASGRGELDSGEVDVNERNTASAKLSEEALEHRAHEEAFRADARARALERAAARAEEVLNNSSHALLLENARGLGIATSARSSRRNSVERAQMTGGPEVGAQEKEKDSENAGAGDRGQVEGGSELADPGEDTEEVDVVTLTERRPVIWGTARFRDLWTGAIRLGESQESEREADASDFKGFVSEKEGMEVGSKEEQLNRGKRVGAKMDRSEVGGVLVGGEEMAEETIGSASEGEEEQAGMVMVEDVRSSRVADEKMGRVDVSTDPAEVIGNGLGIQDGLIIPVLNDESKVGGSMEKTTGAAETEHAISGATPQEGVGDSPMVRKIAWPIEKKHNQGEETSGQDVRNLRIGLEASDCQDAERIEKADGVLKQQTYGSPLFSAGREEQMESDEGGLMSELDEMD